MSEAIIKSRIQIEIHKTPQIAVCNHFDFFAYQSSLIFMKSTYQFSIAKYSFNFLKWCCAQYTVLQKHFTLFCNAFLLGIQ